MANKIIKINLPNTDCKNIYFVNNDELFGSKEIVKTPTYISRDFRLVIRATVINSSGIRLETKKGFSFSKKLTFLQAIKEAVSHKEEIIKKLMSGEVKEQKTRIPTLKEAWEEYVELKRNQLSPNTINCYILVANKWIFSDDKLSKAPITQVTTRRLQDIVNKNARYGHGSKKLKIHKRST